MVERVSGSGNAAAARQWQRGNGVGSATAAVEGWRQHASGCRLGGGGGSLAALRHQQLGGSCTAAAHRHGGNEDTGGNSDGGHQKYKTR